MNLADINITVLKNLSKLVDQKDRLLKEVEKIESQLSNLITGKSPKPTGKRRGRPVKKKNVGRPAKKASASKNPTAPRKKRAARGSIQGKVLAALTAAGDEGVKVVELAKKLGVKGGALHVWFATTGKKHPITKIGKGHYKLTE